MSPHTISLLIQIIILFEITASSNAQQIPRLLVPIAYDLTLTPYFESDSSSYFEGSVVFNFKPLKHHTAQTFSLHADRLTILSILLEENKNKTKQLLKIKSEFNNQNQLLSFDVGFPLSVDISYQLHINYTGNITDDGWGLYKGSYFEDGKKRFYAATQLRPVFGRRLLPCLDEPAYKARFTVRIWRIPSFKAVSNMPLINTSPMSSESGRVLDTFAESPPMSIFLLAMVVFEFASLKSEDGKLMFSSWTIPSKISLAEYGHNTISRLVRAMEEETGSEFPLPKLDQVALPRLNPVAMENWGLNTYRETNILVSAANASPLAKQSVPRFTAHEVAHYWLGNLVSLHWWDHLWITEAYAMYYEYLLPSKVEPSWRMSDQLTVALSGPGLAQDALAGSTPLTTRVNTNDQIMGKFTGLTYTKGPSLIRMIHKMMSENKVKQTLSALVHKKKYSTVNPSELWQIYNKTIEGLPAPMGEIMATWTDQPGYPLITVTTDRSDNTVTLTQERFLQDGSPGEGRWWVPVCLMTGSNAQMRVWVDPRNAFTRIRLPRASHLLIIVNPDRQGFFRVHYASDQWRHLSNALLSSPADVSELSRASLLDDALSLARAGRLAYPTALQLTAYLRREACFFPWASVIPQLTFLLDTFNNHPAHSELKAFLSHLLANVYQHVGLTTRSTDSHLTRLLRQTIAPFACSLRLPLCVSHSIKLQQLISSGKSSVVAPGLESTQLCTVLEAGLLTSAGNNWTEEEQLRAMPCVLNKTELVIYLRKAVNQDSEQQWAAKVTAAIGRPENIQPLLDFMLEHRSAIIKRFGGVIYASYFTQLGIFLSTSSQLKKVESTFERVEDQTVLAPLKAVMDTLRQRIKWIEKYKDVIETWIRQYNKSYKLQNTTLVYCP